MGAKTITWPNFAFQELLSVLTKMSIKFVFFQNRLYLREAEVQSSVLVAVTQWALQTPAGFDSPKIAVCQMLSEEAKWLCHSGV